MDINALLSIVYQSFDRNSIVLISGSQRNNTTFHENSDIDIIVLDQYSSDIHSYPLMRGKLRIDCTVIPLYDIENVLLNEFEHQKGIILTMLNAGKFIAGDHDIVVEIKNIIDNLLKRISFNALKSRRYLFDELHKVLKYLNRPLSKFERTLILSDMTTLISQVECIDKTFREYSYIKKFQILKDNNSPLLDQLEQVFDVTHKREDNVHALVFLKEYLSTKKGNFSTSALRNELLTIDLEVNLETPSEFTSVFLEKINNSPYLKETYQYFYFSTRKYHRIYKHSVTVIFKLADNTTESRISHIVSFLDIVFSNKLLQYNVIDSLQEFNLTFGKLCNQLYILSDLGKSSFPISIKLVHLIATTLSLNYSEVVLLNKYLLQKWMLTRDEQYEVKYHKDILNIQSTRLKSIEKFYKLNKNEFSKYSFFERNISENSNYDIEKILFSICQEVKNIYSNGVFPEGFLTVPDSVLRTIGINDSFSVQLFLKLTQESFKLLNLSDSEKAKAIYISSLLILEE